MNSLNRFADPVYCIMRLIVGLMFACHGGQKILGFPGGGHGGAQGLMLVGGIIELVCGLMIAFGVLTRLAAFISAGEMAVAYFMVHAAGKALGHPPTPTADPRRQPPSRHPQMLRESRRHSNPRIPPSNPPRACLQTSPTVCSVCAAQGSRFRFERPASPAETLPCSLAASSTPSSPVSQPTV